MSKGDKIVFKTPNGNETIEAMTNGSSVAWETEISSKLLWITATEVSKVGKVIRTMKFKAEYVLGILEVPTRPV